MITIDQLRNRLHENEHVDWVRQLALEAAKSTDYLDKLMFVFLENKGRPSRHAAWVLQHVCDIDIQLIVQYQEKLIALMAVPAHDAIHRCVLRSLELMKIKEEWVPLAIDIGFSFLADAAKPVSMKVYSMGLLYNCCKPYPELLAELKLQIETQLPHQSAGFKSKARKVLLKINQAAGRLKNT